MNPKQSPVLTSKGLRCLITHLWWSPSYYMMRLVIRNNPDHPFRQIGSIHEWADNATPLLRQMNWQAWFLITLQTALVCVYIYKF